MSLARKIGALFGTGPTIAQELLTIPPSSPTGPVVPYAGAEAPTGWLFCYGQAVSRATYAALFASIGIVHGTGDGSTTFNLPDMRGRVAAGKDDMGGTAANRLTNAASAVAGATLGASGGSQAHTLTSAQIPAHTHPVTDAGHSHGGVVTGGGAGGSLGVGDNGTTGSTGSSSAGITVDANTGGGQAHMNVQPTIVLNYLIKT